MYYVLLDEVQMVPKFEDVLNSFLHIKNVDTYVTGSNAKFLSKDIITEFRGRGDQIHLYPFSFAEFMQGREMDRYQAWYEYTMYGGLPKILDIENGEDKTAYLKDIFKETYIKDILDYFEDSFLVSKAKRYDVKGKKYISTPMKYYFTDCGLRNVRINFRQYEETHIMENVIYNELLIRGYHVDVGMVEYNYYNEDKKKVQKQLEVDFVCNMGSKRIYVQSALALPTYEKELQEQLSLQSINDSFKKIIIVKEGATHYNESGVFILNLFDFLLKEDSLNQ